GRVRRLPPAREPQPEGLPATAGMGLGPGPFHVVLLEQDLDQEGRSVRTPGGRTGGALLARHGFAQEAVRFLLPLGPAPSPLGAPAHPLIGLERGTAQELGPGQGHSLVVASAALVLVAKEVDEPIVGIRRESLPALFGPLERPVVLLR